MRVASGGGPMSVEDTISYASSEYNRWAVTCVKLAPHLLAPQVMMQVLFAPAIVPDKL